MVYKDTIYRYNVLHTQLLENQPCSIYLIGLISVSYVPFAETAAIPISGDNRVRCDNSGFRCTLRVFQGCLRFDF